MRQMMMDYLRNNDFDDEALEAESEGRVSNYAELEMLDDEDFIDVFALLHTFKG